MKATLLTNLFVVIALFTSASVFAQSAASSITYETAPYNTTQLEYISHHIRQHEESDIESERERREIEQFQLSETTNDKRLTGRQFKIYDEKN